VRLGLRRDKRGGILKVIKLAGEVLS